MAKTIFSGAEDSGKSLQLAMMAGKLVEQNAAWLKITGNPRAIRSNLEFMPWFEDFAKERGVPILYWKDIEEWTSFADCDMICDEIGAYLDSRTFKDLPLDVRLWLAQASKLGVDIYGSAQDFAQIDISFRRLVASDNGGLFHIRKIIGSNRPSATRPPIRRIWGLCMVRELDPVAYDEDSKKFSSNSIMPSWFFIRKEACSIFDTQKRIAKSKPPPYKHIERHCAEPDCNLELYKTIHGVKHKIAHV